MMNKTLATLLRNNWNGIVQSWASCLQATIKDYGFRPIGELRRTTGSHLDGLIEVLESGSYEQLKGFMHDIAPMRLEQGFNLSDIQRAFLTGKQVIHQVIEEAYVEDPVALSMALTELEEPFNRTICEYSDVYQELQIREAEKRSRELSKAEEERRFLRQLRAEREKLDRLVSAIGADIAIIDEDMRVVWYNRYFGREEGNQEVRLGEKCDVLGWHEDGGCQDCASARAFRSGRVEQISIERRDGNGQVRYFQILAAPLRGADGKVEQVLEMMREVTDIRELERRVGTQQEFLEAIRNGSADAIVGLDADDRIIFWNKGAETIFEYTNEEILNKPMTVLAPDRSGRNQKLQRLLAQVRYDNYIRNIETTLLTKAGRQVPVDLTLTAIHDAEGNVIGSSSVIRDVSERRRLEEKVLQAERLATVGRMAAKVAHDIRNPLSSISLNVELLGDEFANLNHASTEEARSLLTSITAEVDRLARIGDEYLHFSRTPKLRLQYTNLNSLLMDLTKLLSKELTARRIRLSRRYARTLPLLKIDRAQMHRAFLNLLRNAMEAMPSGGALRLSTEVTGEGVVARIEDTGVGIPEEELPRIFEPFHSTKDLGTGLGLTITRHIIEEHGGAVDCTSQVGVGTEFVVRLPMSEPATEDFESV